jgi:gas vesicle protein
MVSGEDPLEQNLKQLGWVVAGGLVGAAVACLVSPLSGDQLRRRVRRRIEDQKRALALVASS